MNESLSLALATEVSDQRRKADPLAYWKASSEPQDYAIRQWVRGTWVYAHSGNRSGKTEGLCAVMLAMAQGRESIAGYSEPIRLPVLDPSQGPAMFVLSGESYKALGIGPIATLRRLLGGWEFAEEHAGGPDAVGVFRIKHRLSRSESDWSRIYVFPYEGPLPEGPGLDGWVCDEPAPERFLTALVSRIRAGRVLRSGIAATPRDKAKWFHIRERFPRQERVIVDGKVQLSWPVFANEALSDRDRAQLVSRAKGDKFERAILYGDHVDVVGGNPWPGVDWDSLMAATKAPRLETVSIEGSADGTMAKATLQVWEGAIPGESYYIGGDPAKGIRDGKHDPDGMHVRKRRNKALVARLSGYLGGWGLGNLMADMHFRYNHGVCDPLTTGGYGEAVVQALRKRKVYNLTRDRKETRPGEWEDRIGTIETHEMRGKIVGAVDRSLRSGEFVCPSADVVNCLMDCTVDENGKILASPGSHDEDLILWGRGEVYLGQWDAPKTAPPARKKYESPIDLLLKAQAKRDEALTERIAGKPVRRAPVEQARTVSVEP